MTMLITAGDLRARQPADVPVPEGARRAAGSAGRGARARALRAGLADTARHARRYRDLARFLVCLVCYQAGVQTVIALAAIYAQQAMGFTTQDTIVLILLVNVTAALGAFAFGHVQDRLGHVRTVALTLVGWIVIDRWSPGGPTDRATFWVAANLAGLCLGASQSAGRALVGYLSARRGPARRVLRPVGPRGEARRRSSGR